ncbi:hypothetical protein Tco_0626180 [Tanacetum coccineum]|uniref:Uncharacterized protein n=1 Tax=Tanacetum coccineum TaxID=301880 RepID=A0ABQ4WIW6_9ASTR
MESFLALKQVVYDTNSLLEQWKESYENANYDYDPYDDDMYECQDVPDKIQSICDKLDIKVRGRKKKYLIEEILRYCSDNLYAVSIKKDTTYLYLHFTRNHEELKSNTPYPEDSILRIEDYMKILEDIERGPYSKKPPIRSIDLTQYDWLLANTFRNYEDGKHEIVEIIRIKTGTFDFETPLCMAFNEFNYLLEVDTDLFTHDIQEAKTYKEHKNELNNDPEEPWSENGVPYELIDHLCKLFHFKNGKTKWPTCSSNEDGFCNGGELPRMVRVGYMTYFQDYKWYDVLKNGKLKDEALKQKAMNNEEAILEERKLNDDHVILAKRRNNTIKIGAKCLEIPAKNR